VTGKEMLITARKAAERPTAMTYTYCKWPIASAAEHETIKNAGHYPRDFARRWRLAVELRHRVNHLRHHLRRRLGYLDKLARTRSLRPWMRAYAVEKRAQFQNGFGAWANAQVVGKYDLRAKKVLDVAISQN
jgi:hypothetical protein